MRSIEPDRRRLVAWEEAEESHRLREFVPRLRGHNEVAARLALVEDDEWFPPGEACRLLGVTEPWLAQKIEAGQLDVFTQAKAPGRGKVAVVAASGLALKRFHGRRVAPYKPIDGRWRIVTDGWLRLPDSGEFDGPWQVRDTEGRWQGPYEMRHLPIDYDGDPTVMVHRHIWLIDDHTHVIEGPFIDMRHVGRTLRWRREQAGLVPPRRSLA